jgi:hypothetical protein
LRHWLVDVVPSITPWFSGDDIETGKFWQLELLKSLERSTVGIVVITPANAHRPWLNFEAGRLSSSIESRGGVVMPLLVNLESADITGTPLSTLNAVTFNELGVWKIVNAIHERTGNDMNTTMLKNLFDLKWVELKQAVTDAVDHAIRTDVDNVKPQQRDTSDVLEDLITTVNELRQDVRRNTADQVSWSPVDENAIDGEVRSIIAPSGVTPLEVEIRHIQRNGVIYVDITFDDDISDALMREIEMRLRSAPRYRPHVWVYNQGQRIRNRSGSGVVDLTNPRENKESDDQ